MPTWEELLRRFTLEQQQRLKAQIDARKEAERPTLRIGDRLQTGQYKVIHPTGSTTSNGVKIFNTSHPIEQVVRGTQASGQPTIALDWRNVRKQKEMPEVAEPAPQVFARILALGDYYGFADPNYITYPDNKKFALNMFDWLGSGRKRISTFSTESLQDIGGDISIDAPEFAGLQADLDLRGFSINAIDLTSGDLEAALNSCDIFFCPLILSNSHQLNTAQATLLADFTRRKKGLVMVSGWQTSSNYTGLYEVFGIQPIASASVTVVPVSPIPASLKTLLTGVASYRINSGDGQGGLIFADPGSPHTFTKLFAQGSLLSPFNSGFSIELAEEP